MSTITRDDCLFLPARVRRDDPAPSHRAASAFTASGAEHGQRYIVMKVLREHGPCNTHRLAELSGLRVDQLDRRALQWETQGLIVREDLGGPSLTWRIV